jgi:hypothetical protein
VSASSDLVPGRHNLSAEAPTRLVVGPGAAPAIIWQVDGEAEPVDVAALDAAVADLLLGLSADGDRLPPPPPAAKKRTKQVGKERK